MLFSDIVLLLLRVKKETCFILNPHFPWIPLIPPLSGCYESLFTVHWLCGLRMFRRVNLHSS
jgi:hypothetical protein